MTDHVLTFHNLCWRMRRRLRFLDGYPHNQDHRFRRVSHTLSRMVARLAYITLNEHQPPDIVAFAGTDAESNENWWRRVANDSTYDKEVYNPEDDWVFRTLRDFGNGSARQRKRSLIWRASEQADWAAQRGWYTIFDTLTISSQYIDDAKVVLTKCWKDYSRSVADAVGIKIYGSQRERRKVPESQYIHHLCTVERGSERGRLHMHVVWYCRDIPDEWKIDPNLTLSVPTRRYIPAMKRLWKWGWNEPIAVRYGKNDPWGKLNWRWPLDKTGKTPVFFSEPSALGAYLAKYIGKQGDLSRHFRTRVSRGFGMQRLREWIQTQSNDLPLLQALTAIRAVPHLPVPPLAQQRQRLIRPPSSLVRREAKRQLWLQRLRVDTRATVRQIMCWESISLISTLRALQQTQSEHDRKYGLYRLWQQCQAAAGCYDDQERAWHKVDTELSKFVTRKSAVQPRPGKE